MLTGEAGPVEPVFLESAAPQTPMTSNPEPPRLNCVLRYHPDGFRIDRKAVMGRQSAGAGFIKGFVEHGGTDRLVALTDSEKHFEDFRGLANALDRTGRTVVRVRPRDRQTLRDVGTVFLPGPGLDSEAWNRRLGSERDYSLCGVTHTIATSRVAKVLGQYLIAPTQPWDALVCTSKAVRDGVGRILEQHADYLARRGGGRLRCPVRLPVVPLGVDCDAYARGVGNGAPDTGPGKRHELRQRLGITAEDFVVLFVGRLSFHGKAHPTPMYMAAARAAQRVRDGTVHLLLAGQFSNRAIETEFREAAARFCGAARAHFLDGSDGPHGPGILVAMQAADIFLSLSDNIQETFGLTPVEAMAAGLPCVVSDWDGYRDTVIDGETGFRIPTVTVPPGGGVDIADRYAAGLDTYDRMIGIASLATAVDIDACAEAIARLANNRELLAHQGAAGRARARLLYDWRVVVAAYQDLWAELAEIRAASAGVGLRDHATQSANVDYPDPFAIYRAYPTALLGPNTVVAAKNDDPAENLARLRGGQLHSYADYAFLPDAGVDALMARLVASGPARAADLAARYPGRPRILVRTLLWLKKFDLVEFEPGPQAR